MTEEQTRNFHCDKCGNDWRVPFGGGRQLVCPKCGSMNIFRANPGTRSEMCGAMRRKTCKRRRSE